MWFLAFEFSISRNILIAVIFGRIYLRRSPWLKRDFFLKVNTRHVLKSTSSWHNPFSSLILHTCRVEHSQKASRAKLLSMLLLYTPSNMTNSLCTVESISWLPTSRREKQNTPISSSTTCWRNSSRVYHHSQCIVHGKPARCRTPIGETKPGLAGSSYYPPWPEQEAKKCIWPRFFIVEGDSGGTNSGQEAPKANKMSSWRWRQPCRPKRAAWEKLHDSSMWIWWYASLKECPGIIVCLLFYLTCHCIQVLRLWNSEDLK